MDEPAIHRAQKILGKFDAQEVMIDLYELPPFHEARDIEMRFMIAINDFSTYRKYGYHEGVLRTAEDILRHYVWLNERGYVKESGWWKRPLDKHGA